MQCWGQCLFFYWLVEIPSSISWNRCHGCKAVLSQSGFEHFTPTGTHTAPLVKRLETESLSHLRFFFTLKTLCLTSRAKERARNCNQNVFTQWHIFSYLLNLVGRNNITACTESILHGTNPTRSSITLERRYGGKTLWLLMATTARLLWLKGQIWMKRNCFRVVVFFFLFIKISMNEWIN